MTTQINMRKTLPDNSFSQFLRGLTYPLEGLRFLKEHQLWSLAGAAILVNVVLLIAMIAMASVYLVPLIQGWVAGMAAGRWQHCFGLDHGHFELPPVVLGRTGGPGARFSGADARGSNGGQPVSRQSFRKSRVHCSRYRSSSSNRQPHH